VNSSSPNNSSGSCARSRCCWAHYSWFATLLLYGSVRHHEFLDFDDSQYVTKNIHVSTGLKLGNVVWAFTTFYAANWHPVTWLSHMTDCQLFGLNSGSQHKSMSRSMQSTFYCCSPAAKATGAVWRSFFVAALFAVHPLNVETVAWVAERKSLLSTLFSLLTIAAYGWYVRRPDWKKYLLVVAAFSLGADVQAHGSEPPAGLLLLDYWPLQRTRKSSISTQVGAVVAGEGASLLDERSKFRRHYRSRSVLVVVVDTSALPLSLRWEMPSCPMLHTLGKLFWPAKLAVFYPHPQHSLPWSDVIAAAVILSAITTRCCIFTALATWQWAGFSLS
jgi:protein O-mannosyl-transferase